MTRVQDGIGGWIEEIANRHESNGAARWRKHEMRHSGTAKSWLTASTEKQRIKQYRNEPSKRTEDNPARKQGLRVLGAIVA